MCRSVEYNTWIASQARNDGEKGAVSKEFLPQRAQRTRKGRKINNFEYQYFANFAKILASFAVRELSFFRSAPNYSVINH
jgi:hypothetical protein